MSVGGLDARGFP
uniref:Uncharacterized protein n=1 Tax=Rhizophora mucronata TaxID=61149 RepID=A0A2P2R415_RHIMU